MEPRRQQQPGQGARHDEQAAGKVEAAPAAGARNNVRPTGRPGPQNSIRPYRPATIQGVDAQINRQAKAGIERIKAAGQKLRDGVDKAMPKLNKMKMQLQRGNARAIADRGKKGIDGEIARIEIGTIGGNMGAKAIKRRLARAAEGVKRGSKPAQRAQEIYMNQLARWPGGKEVGKNNARPGPRNASPPPKKRGKRKKK